MLILNAVALMASVMRHGPQKGYWNCLELRLADSDIVKFA
jgi:hypothetical protein